MTRRAALSTFCAGFCSDSGNRPHSRPGSTDAAKLPGGFVFTEGPACSARGELFFTDVGAERIYAYRDGVIRVVRNSSNVATGLALDSRNRLLVCERGRLTRTEADGKLTILVDSFEGKGLHSPHDVAVRSDRTVFFTDLKPEKEWANPAKVGFSGVYELRSTGEMFLFPREYAGPNGIALSPDEDRLYVAERVKPNENVTRPDLGCAI